VALIAIFYVGLSAGCATGSAGTLAARQRAATATAGTIESTDPRLSAALLAEAALPSAESHLQVAREYFRLGILDFAHKRTERALKRQPGMAAAHDLLARIWRDWGMPVVALGHGHRAIYYEPGSAGARNTLGTVLDALGRTDEARSAFLKAFELDSTAGWALSNLCYLEFRLGNFETARRHCEAAVRASPALAAAHNNLGLTHAASGDLELAHEAFRAGGDEAAAHYNMGIVHLAARRYAEAAAAFARAVDARPEFNAAKTRAHEARMRAMRADRKKP
jgi:tetratricopeptide (TPR) repeat protein